MASHIDDVKQHLKALDLTVEREVRGAHIKLYLRNAHGCQCVMVFAKTPSDLRSCKNELARLRRFARLTEKSPRC